MVEYIFYCTVTIQVATFFVTTGQRSRQYENLLLFIVICMVDFQFYRSMDYIKACHEDAGLTYILLSTWCFLTMVIVFRKHPLGLVGRKQTFSDAINFIPLALIVTLSMAAFIAMAGLTGGVDVFFTAEGAASADWSGSIVIANFFAQQIFFLMPYLIISLYVSKRNRLGIAICTLFGFLLTIAYSFLLVRRSMLLYLFLYILLWRHLNGRFKFPRPVWIALGIVATIGLSAIGEIRKSVIFGQDLDATLIANELFTTHKTGDVLNGILAITYAQNGAPLSLGTEVLKKLVADYVPRGFLDDKTSLVAEDRPNFYDVCTGIMPPPNEFFTAFGTLYTSASWGALFIIALFPLLICAVRPGKWVFGMQTDPLFINVMHAASISIIYSHSFLASQLLNAFAIQIFIGLPLWRGKKKVVRQIKPGIPESSGQTSEQKILGA